jgi:hypothetical protein
MANKKKKVTQATRRKISRASKLYQKVRKTVSKELEKQEKPLKGKDLTAFIKEKIYPEYKGLSSREVKIADIRLSVERALTGGSGVINIGDFVNPLSIPITLLSGVFWFDLDNFIDVDLTAETGGKNLRFEVNAGEYGSTGIIDLSEYTYEGSGLNDIIESVRDYIQGEMPENESEPYWEGEVRVRPNRQDDGNPDSYFIQFTIFVGGQQIPPSETFEEAQPMVLSEETLEERRTRRREIVKRRKELAKEKREKARKKDIRGRERPTVKVTPKEEQVKKEPKVKAEPKFDKRRADNIQKALDRQERLLADSKALYDAKGMTNKQYLAERASIIAQTTAAIEKFKRGGKI